MRRSGLLLGLFFALTAGAEGVSPVDPGLYSVTTAVETETADPGTGTILDTWTDTYSGATCLVGEADRRVRPDTFADERCSFTNVRPDPYGEAFDAVCRFDEGVLTGSGTLAVDPAHPGEFRQAFALRGDGGVASQRITIKGKRVGACPEPAGAP